MKGCVTLTEDAAPAEVLHVDEEGGHEGVGVRLRLLPAHDAPVVAAAPFLDVAQLEGGGGAAGAADTTEVTGLKRQTINLSS